MFKYLILNHIPRCGGSSLRKGVYEATKHNRYFQQYPCYISQYTHANICLYDQPHLIEAIHPETLLFIDHSPSFFIEDIFNINAQYTYRIITLRNPISRIISHIHYFYSKHINTLSKTILSNYLKRFGNTTIYYLTKHRYSDKSLIEQYHLAEDILNDYQFHFRVEDQKLCEIFNNSNPFELHMTNYHINQSPIDSSLEVDQKIKNTIYKEIKLEIKLLEKYYEMDL